jgi:hypothetical protein
VEIHLTNQIATVEFVDEWEMCETSAIKHIPPLEPCLADRVVAVERRTILTRAKPGGPEESLLLSEPASSPSSLSSSIGIVRPRITLVAVISGDDLTVSDVAVLRALRALLQSLKNSYVRSAFASDFAPIIEVKRIHVLRISRLGPLRPDVEGMGCKVDMIWFGCTLWQQTKEE